MSLSTSTMVSAFTLELLKPQLNAEGKLSDELAVTLVENATAIARAMVATGLLINEEQEH